MVALSNLWAIFSLVKSSVLVKIEAISYMLSLVTRSASKTAAFSNLEAIYEYSSMTLLVLVASLSLESTSGSFLVTPLALATSSSLEATSGSSLVTLLALVAASSSLEAISEPALLNSITSTAFLSFEETS